MIMKRSLEDSDCDDFLDGDDCHTVGSPTQSCQVMNRKKRRGVIEKRRRDRINASLSELKRLVPSAFEKQGSAKLEKAEILQMTVDHLKMLNARGLNNPATFEADYRGMGFRECVAETARYLAAAEGLDLQNPLRLRLLGHLEAYGAQKEISLKAELTGYNWHRLSGYAAASQSALYPTASQDSSANPLSAKLKEPSYGTSYPSSTPSYYGQVPGLNNAFNSTSSALPQQGGNSGSFSSATGLSNLSPNALYATGNYNSDVYKSFRPW